MKKTMNMILCLASIFCTSSTAVASDSVGLGMSLGIVFPNGEINDNLDFDDGNAEFNWGFFVNIPLISTVHLTPSAELYKLGSQNATDMSLAVKFVVNAWMVDFFFGFAPGLTTVGDVTAVNVGGLGGVSFNLFSNLDFFIQAKYKVILNGGHNTRVLHTNAGVLFIF
jgi:hypothetical protein